MSANLGQPSGNDPQTLRRRLTLQTQLYLPLMPFIVDTAARILFLRHNIAWYEIPDLVALLATFSFFCLALLFSTRTPAVPSDSELALNVEIVKQNLLIIVVISMMFAGGLSFLRAIEERYPNLKLNEDVGLIIFISVLFFIIAASVPIRRKYMFYVGG